MPIEWKYKPGDLLVFSTMDTAWKHKDGTKCRIVRRETEDEADFAEVGPMYRIRFKDDATYADAYEDELSPVEGVKVEPRTYTSDELSVRGLDDGDCPVCGCTDVWQRGPRFYHGRITLMCHCDSCDIDYELLYEFKEARVLNSLKPATKQP